MQQLSYDGSFQLVRKNKAFDSHDTCLSDGTKYFVEQAAYKHHLESNKDTAYLQSTRVGTTFFTGTKCVQYLCLIGIRMQQSLGGKRYLGACRGGG
jgi:hypothetical protein